jgi:hypothetical protein
MKQTLYRINVTLPAGLQAATVMFDENKSTDQDQYSVHRYAGLVDHPVMYSKPDIASTRIGNMDVL